VAARRDDIGEIRELLQTIRDARVNRAYAEQELARKRATEQRQQAEAAVVAARLAAARAAAGEALTAWTARWSQPAAPSFNRFDTRFDPELPCHVISGSDAATLSAALDRSGEPGAASLSEIYDGCVSDRRAAAIAARTRLDAALTEARRRRRASVKNATPSRPSGTTRLRPPTCAQPAAKVAPVPRFGSLSGSPPRSRTTPLPRLRVPCTGPACSPPGCTQTRH
jgi:hypothetical protein